MRKWIQLTAVFSVCAIGSGVIASERIANANYRRVTADSCQVVYQSSGSNMARNDNSGAIGNYADNSTVVDVSCPFIDDTTTNKATVSGVYYDVYQGLNGPFNYSTEPSAEACLEKYDSSTVTCAGGVFGPSHGWNSLSLDLSGWRNSSYGAWYPYVLVSLPG